ncbi:MAG: hypothetical protein R3202_07670, partial [Candidatus Competibacterales bacterium]|nr:hypothetical protein [Candidatus Competibacterales bacterium]
SGDGWLLPLPGALLGPRDLLQTPAAARAGSVRLEVAGELVPLATEPVGRALARLDRTHGHPSWPRDRIRPPEPPENVLLMAGSALSPRLIGNERQQLTAAGDWWLRPVSPASTWHGAAVVAARDGALLGLALAVDDRLRVEPLPDMAHPPSAGDD